MTVSVVVVNWNRRKLLEACLLSLERQAFGDFEVIVVDNGSSDDSSELLKTWQKPRRRVIWNRANRGFCGANNQGIEAAEGDYVALLNNDAEAHEDWLGGLVAALEADPGLGMAASKIVTHADPTILDKVGHLIYLDGQNRGRGTGEQDRGQYDGLTDTAWPDGCAALYRRAMLDQIGGFDEDFFAYADDAELGLRGRIAGWGAIYVPAAVVRHHRGSTLGEFSAERLYLIERNRIWLAAKLFPWRVLALNPFLASARWLALAAAALSGSGDAATAGSGLGIIPLIKCFLRAQVRGLAGVPRMLLKRAEIRRFRKLSGRDVTALLWRYRISLGRLVFGPR